jgi:hypothetical protein
LVRRSARRVVPIGLSLRSWLTAWVRVVMTPLLVVLVLSPLLVAVRQPGQPPLVVALGVATALVSLVALVALLIPNKASPRRIEALQRWLRPKGAPDPRQDLLLAVALQPRTATAPPAGGAGDRGKKEERGAD